MKGKRKLKSRASSKERQVLQADFIVHTALHEQMFPQCLLPNRTKAEILSLVFQAPGDLFPTCPW